MAAEITNVHPVLMARDVLASLAFYERLGFAEVFRDDAESPRYAAVRRGAVELHLQWGGMPRSGRMTETGPPIASRPTTSTHSTTSSVPPVRWRPSREARVRLPPTRHGARGSFTFVILVGTCCSSTPESVTVHSGQPAGDCGGNLPRARPVGG